VVYLVSSDYGIVSLAYSSRLTSDAYLLVFLPSDAAPLFPTQEDSSYKVNTLGAVYSIPLHPELAPAAIDQLQSLQVSLQRLADNMPSARADHRMRPGEEHQLEDQDGALGSTSNRRQRKRPSCKHWQNQRRRKAQTTKMTG